MTNALELHLFSDASELAYGTVAYIRLPGAYGSFRTWLLCSKTRVAPLPRKKVSLPRLELISCLLSIDLTGFISKSIRRPWTITYWSDSKVALGWIKGDPFRCKVFVKNRVDRIRRNSTAQAWRHVPGVENPADLASRGSSADKLVDSTLWWQGPSWLIRPENEWPESSGQEDTETKKIIE